MSSTPQQAELFANLEVSDLLIAVAAVQEIRPPIISRVSSVSVNVTDAGTPRSGAAKGFQKNIHIDYEEEEEEERSYLDHEMEWTDLGLSFQLHCMTRR